MHNVIKLNEKIHQLKTQITKSIMLIYFEMIHLMISKIFESNLNDENFDNDDIVDEISIVTSSTTNNKLNISQKFNENNFDFQIVNFFE